MEPQEKTEGGKQCRAAAKRKFTKKCNVFREPISENNPVAILESNFSVVQEAYSAVETVHERYVDSLASNKEISEVQLETEYHYILKLERKRNEMHVMQVNASESKERNETKPTVKVKALDSPKFEGNIRDYPSFKSDFERLMNNSYGKKPYALKQCLDGDALKVVLGVKDDYDEMLKSLDESFGNTRRIVDAVINYLRSLRRISDGDWKGFVKMI